MSDCANEAMADPIGLNLPSTEVISCNNMMASNFESAHTTNVHRISSGAAAAAAQLDPKYIIAHSGPIGSSSQQHTAAAFFASKKASTHHAKLASPMHQIANGNMSSNHNSKDDKNTNHQHHHVCDYSTVLNKCPPPTPSCLLKKMELTEVSGLGKVRVVLRVADSGVIDDGRIGSNSYFQMDKKKRQVTIFDPSSMKSEGLTSTVSDNNADRKIDVAAPKMFAFDGLFTDEDSQSDVSTSALTDTIHSVVNGTDGCLFCFGHNNLGKTYTMIGSDESSKTVGVIPSAIAWLYRCIKEKKDKLGTKFSIRVSAVEIGGAKEDLRDLLQCHENDSDQDLPGAPPPSAFIPHKSGMKIGNSLSMSHGSLLQNLTELRSPSAGKAGYFLDSALTARSTNMAADVSGRDSHFIFTLHVYQYAGDKTSSTTNSNGSRKSIGNNVIGGRSRLHLIDFGGCERTKTSGGGITLSGLGNVILAIFNGQRHLPCKESRVTAILKECLGSLSCQATMLAHVSPLPSHYSETLHTTQLASRIHRMRRKKSKGSGGSGGGSGSGSSDETKNKLVKIIPGSGTSSCTSTDPSSSEQSCDTVIYVGSRDDDGTDAEHPPVYIPSLDSGDARGIMANVLRGSSAELPNHSSTSKGSRKSSSSTLERRRQSKSPASSLTNHKVLSTVRQRPGSVGSTPVRNGSQQQSRLSSCKQSNQNSSSPLTLQNSHNAHLMAQYNMGRGSLPRNPRGKMPLYGKVAGYRQPASNSNAAVVAQEYWIDQKGALTYQAENTPPHSKPNARHNQQTFLHPYSGQQPKSKTSSHQGSVGSPCHDRPLTIEQQAAIYGYMDDHKISMIHNWVECQTEQMQTTVSSSAHRTPQHQPNPLIFHPSQVVANPSHFQQPLESQQEPVPFAWLNQPMNHDLEDENGCKVLTQFKTVDSSDDSFSDGAQQQQIEIQQLKNKEHHSSKKRSSHTQSHSGGSANHSVVAVDIHTQPKVYQHHRTSKVSCKSADCNITQKTKSDCQKLHDNLSTSTPFTKDTNVYSSIERKPKQNAMPVKPTQQSPLGNKCGQGDKQQPIYATINHEAKRNKRNGDTNIIPQETKTYAVSKTIHTNETKICKETSVDLGSDINQREHSSYCNIPTITSSVNAFSKPSDEGNNGNANAENIPRAILVKQASNEGHNVHSSSQCYVPPNSKAEGLLSETKNGNATVVEQQWSNMNSLDELYNHCEQLVETLSQASEDIMHMEREEYLQVFKRKSTSITREEQEKIPDIHQTEILLDDEYEEIDRMVQQKEGFPSTEIDKNGVESRKTDCKDSKSGNHVKEEEKLSLECEKDQQKVNIGENGCLNNQNQTNPPLVNEHKQQDPPLRMLSEENLATTVSSFDGQALHYVGSKCNKVFEHRRYNHIKDMKTKTKNTNGSNFNNGIKDGIQEQIQPSMFETVDESFGNVQTDLVNVDGAVDHEEYFSKKFDQLAKLHELYQSVSSISAKSQNHLNAAREENEKNMCNYNVGGLRGSTLSLSALLNDLERASIGGGSNADSEVNSLCSEPVKMYDYNDFVDINKNNALSTLSMTDIFDDICGNKNSLSDIHAKNEKNSLHHNKSTMSLCELSIDGMSIDNKAALNGEQTTKGRLCFYSSEMNVAENRSDSPILAEIDQELAKYAKLKDLKHAYDPTHTITTPYKPNTTLSPSSSSLATTKNDVAIVQKSGKVEKGEVKINDDQQGITNTTSKNNGNSGGLSTLLRQPDGASNPDLNYKLPCNNNNSNVSSSSHTNNAVSAAIVPSVILHQNECFPPSKPSVSLYNNKVKLNSRFDREQKSLGLGSMKLNSMDNHDSNETRGLIDVNPLQTDMNNDSSPVQMISDRRSPGNGQSGSDPEPEQLEMLSLEGSKRNDDLIPNHNQTLNQGLQASTSSSSSLSTSATSTSNYSREGKQNNNNLNNGFAVIHRYGRGMQLNSRNQRTIIGKSQSTTDCDTSSEHEVWVENKGTTTSAKHVLPPSVNEKNVFSHNLHLQDTPSSKMDNKHNDDVDLSTNQGSTKCLNDKNKNEIFSIQKSKAPKFSRLFKLSRSPLKIVKVQAKARPSEVTNKQDIVNQNSCPINIKNKASSGKQTNISTQQPFINAKKVKEKKPSETCNGNIDNGIKEPHHYHHPNHNKNNSALKSTLIDKTVNGSSCKRIGGDSNNKNGLKGFKDIHQSSPTLLSSSSSPVRSNNRQSQESKNAKGTSSSESLRVSTNKTCKNSDSLFRPNNNLNDNYMKKHKHENNSYKRFFVMGGKKNLVTKGTKGQQQNFSVVPALDMKSLPSPYSFNTKPKFAKSGFKHDAEISSGSEYDSGHDSGILPTEAASFCDKINSDNSKPKTSSFIKTCRFVKLRSNKGGRGGANNSYTKTSMSSLHSSNTNSPSSPSQKKNIRASHCKSSGYESSAGERDSIDSVKGSLEPHGCNELVEMNHGGENTKLQNGTDKVTLTKIPRRNNVYGSSILAYEKDFIERLDKRWRFDEVRRLRQSQNGLKDELSKAKERISADPKRWSFELHVEENLTNSDPGIKDTDPTFVEALDKETKILGKRVDACKSHAILQTCFDYHPPLTVALLHESISKDENNGISSLPESLALKDNLPKSTKEENDKRLSPLTQKLFDNCCTTDCDHVHDMILPSTNETEIF